MYAAVPSLLVPGAAYDQLSMVSGTSLTHKLIPFMATHYDWRDTYLDKTLNDRCLTGIPNFSYKDDSSQLYHLIYDYVQAFLCPF